MMKHWDGKMGQCSVLMLHLRTTPFVLLRHLLHLPDQKRKTKIPAAVKVCIMDALRRSRNGHLSNGTAFLHRRSEVGKMFLWACNSKTTPDTILTWHIATSILEVRYPFRHDQAQGSPSISDHKNNDNFDPR
uniref:Uncharacterized protein n=1 Tax=Arundo donax TaxID=35708 RepID=A0A0A9AKH1_ARUDO